MRIYLDDDIASPVLTQLLRKARLDVTHPTDSGLRGADDPVHLTYAIRNDCVLLSRNYRDFENLHNLIIAARGHHPGILIVRRDNDPKRNLTHAGIIQAIKKLTAAGFAMGDQYVNLNSWR
jgi:predicted nuclease of predicted toxin-antitoxin system